MEKFMRKPSVVAILALVCCALWGSAFPCVKIGYDLFCIEEVGSQILFVNIFLEFGRTTNLIGINGLRATGDVKFPVYIAIFSMWTFAVGISYVLGIGLGLGLIGVWIGFALDEIIRGVLVALRWKSRKWEEKSFVR